MRRHGFTVLGRTLAEAYHRTQVRVSEVKRNGLAEMLAKLNGTMPDYIPLDDMQWMSGRGDRVVYPQLVRSGA